MSQIVNVDDLPTDKPVLLLDIDGVFNIFNQDENTDLYEYFIAQEIYKIQMRLALIDHMEELTEHFVLVWCTTWDELANEYFADRLKMPFLPVVPTREARRGGFSGTKPPLLAPIPNVHWKTSAIVKYIKDRPYAWVDDELGQGDQDYADMRTAMVAPTLMLRTEEHEGLVQRHVDELITWAEAYQASR